MLSGESDEGMKNRSEAEREEQQERNERAESKRIKHTRKPIQRTVTVLAASHRRRRGLMSNDEGQLRRAHQSSPERHRLLLWLLLSLRLLQLRRVRR